MSAVMSKAEQKAVPEKTQPPVNMCPHCSEVNQAPTPRLHDKKGVHKCAQCRRDLLPEYEAKLPGIKKALREQYGIKEAKETPKG